MGDHAFAIACFLIVVAALVIGTAAFSFFYLQVSLLFILIGVLVFIRVFFEFFIGWELINRFFAIGCLIYSALLILIPAAIFHALGFTLTAYVIMGFPVAIIIVLVMAGWACRLYETLGF
jgi:hypothetical protein